MTLAEEVGAALEAARGDRTRRQLAADNNISNTALLNIEHGRANPTLERLERLAEAYGVRLHITAEPLPAADRARAEASA